MERDGHLLVVQQWQTEQRAPLQGVQDLDEGDQRALDRGWEGIRKGTSPLRVGRASDIGSGRHGRGPATHQSGIYYLTTGSPRRVTRDFGRPLYRQGYGWDFYRCIC